MKTRIDYKALGQAVGLVLAAFVLLAIIVAYAFFVDWLYETRGLDSALLAGVLAPFGVFFIIISYFLFKEV